MAQATTSFLWCHIQRRAFNMCRSWWNGHVLWGAGNDVNHQISTNKDVLAQRNQSPFEANVMLINCFEKIKQFFHGNDNTKHLPEIQKDQDILYKVRPVVNSLVEKCMQVPHEEYQSVNEQITPPKSHTSLRQYLHNKLNRFIREIIHGRSPARFAHGWLYCVSLDLTTAKKDQPQSILWQFLFFNNPDEFL